MRRIIPDNAILQDRYDIERYFDEGGMQEVYLAYDSLLGKTVVVKTPKNSSAKKRFRQSAVLSARISHPNVAHVLDYFEENDTFYLVEEYVEGSSLGKLFKNKFNYFDPHLVSQLGHHLSSGLAASHHAGVIHRDLKLGNIIAEVVSGVYIFKITDFGVAKLAELEFQDNFKDHSTMMSSSTIVGAIPFMAPEVIKESSNASFKSDVWSIGAILYTCLVGSPPFGSSLESVGRILAHDSSPLPVSDYGLFQFSTLVKKLSDIITMCLAVDSQLRPNSDELKGLFSELCYMNSVRAEGVVRAYPLDRVNGGFITENNFFHRNSFFGSTDNCTVGRKVLYGCNPYCGNRVHPVLPLK